MLYIPLRISTDINITVTTTATKLYTLMDTASTLDNAQTYYDDEHSNAVLISPEGGDIRYLIGTDPTASDGTLISAGTTWYLPGVELSEIRLISTTLATAAVTVVPYLAEKGESPCMVASDVTLEVGLVTDTDDDSVAGGQVPQLEISENYLYSKTNGAWNRMQGTDAGYLITSESRISSDIDDDAIDKNGTRQTLMNLNYGFDVGTDVWERLVTDGSGHQINEVIQPTAADLNATVVATDLDIRDLTHVSDSVSIGDGTEIVAVDTASRLTVIDGGLKGASTDGSVALTGANTWVQVPTAAPASDYILAVSKENEAGTIRWSFTNGGTPGVANGNRMWSDEIGIPLAANQVLYFGSTDAGDDVNWTAKIL